MYFDTHIHSEFSFDSTMTVTEILEKQKELNIGISLTEHLDFDLINLPIINLDEYLNHYRKYHNDRFLLGIELGMSKVNSNITKNFARENKDRLDIIIGSIHSLYGQDIFYLMRDIKKDKKTVYTDYLLNMLYCVKDFDFYDTLAHIDYISRYAKYDDVEIHLDDFSDIIDEILTTLINKKKCIEINTRRLDNTNAYNALFKIYQRYQELGGRYVTIASDSHNKNSIGTNFDLAKQMINELDLTPVYFNKRKMITLKI